MLHCQIQEFLRGETTVELPFVDGKYSFRMLQLFLHVFPFSIVLFPEDTKVLDMWRKTIHLGMQLPQRNTNRRGNKSKLKSRHHIFHMLHKSLFQIKQRLQMLRFAAPSSNITNEVNIYSFYVLP